ncbi:MAG TPA: alanine dehydrogenase [Bacteroidales bacterium]|nr:alanine dehydrogenase [Bacteroidales bacterium]
MGRQDIPQGSFNIPKQSLIPQEEMLEIGKKQNQLVIGIPKESDIYESRVPLTPEAVEILVDNGHSILLESDAGLSANYLNTQYSDVGAMIVDKADVLKADIILKIAPLTVKEIAGLKGNQLILSSLHMRNHSEEYIRSMMQKKITAISFENVKDQYNCYPVVRSMSEIAGNTAILIAAEYLNNANKGKGVMLGGVTGITPTEVVIIGAGTAGESAARAALGLGAFVKIMDNSIHKLQRLQNHLGLRLHTSVLHPQTLKKALKSADVVIGAVHLTGMEQVVIVTEEMVSQMKKGSVIVDISIDQGGCFETSEVRNHGDPVFRKYDVVHYCVPNIASRVARTASIALSNVMGPILKDIASSGSITQTLKTNLGLRHGVYLYNGILTNHVIGKMLDIPAQDINLLMAAF